jgi:hypothetical protein
MSTPENTVWRSAATCAVYLNSMRAAVYRLRERGVKLPRPKEPREGELMLGLCERGDTRYLKAQLVDAQQDLLAPLMNAQVTRITRNGLVIKGVEVASRVPGSIKAKVSSYPQTWWVLVHTGDLSDLLAGGDLLDEIGHFGHAA